MSEIIAGRFATFEQAQQAQALLQDRGFETDDLSVFYVNPPGRHDMTAVGGDQFADKGARKSTRGVLIGAVLGALTGVVFGLVAAVASPRMEALIFMVATGIGAYAGSLIGALTSTAEKPAPGAEPVPHERAAGVMLAARVIDAPTHDAAIAAFEQAAALDIEHATGEWDHGEWTDFNPIVPPQLEPDTPAHRNASRPTRVAAGAH
ncbi:hypothetical protein BH09PSE6_BH09PSE6_23570 [soil metagenome]